MNDTNQTKNYKLFCHVESQIEDRKFGLLQDVSCVGDLRDSKSTSEGLLCVSGSHEAILSLARQQFHARELGAFRVITYPERHDPHGSAVLTDAAGGGVELRPDKST